MNVKKGSFRVKVTVCIFVSLSIILMYFRVRIPIFPNFLDFDLSDIPIFFISLVFSPLMGILALFVKNLLVCLLMGSFTYGVGEIANFLMGGSFIFIASYLFKNLKSYKYILSYVFGLLALILSSLVLNYFVILPVYGRVLGITIEEIIGGSNLFKFLLVVIVPYNIIKSIIIFFPIIFILNKFKKINSRNSS